MTTAGTPMSLMATHSRLRANGFGIVSVVSARSSLDARVWLGQWCRGNDRALIVAPGVTAEEALNSYIARLGTSGRLEELDPTRLPVLFIPGSLVHALPASSELVARYRQLPVAIACSLADVVDSLLNSDTPISLVTKALEGLVPTEDAERKVLNTVAEGRKLQPFLRGACEGLVYYMLQARAETRDRFEANARVDNTSSNRRHEVDLLCSSARLIIEIDGPEHQQTKRKAMDGQKQADLEGQGYCVRRFSNEQVIEDPVGVWRLIHELLVRRTNVEEVI